MKGLYLITDEKLTPYERIEKYLTPALENGVKIIQFRDKNSDENILLDTALKIQKICKKYKAKLIINDYIDLAKEIDADGLHIGQDDEDFLIARRILGKKKIIGVTCYGDILRAKEFEHRGADYVAFGSFFHSSTKPNANVINTNLLLEAKKIINVPICAIGGITDKNISILIKNGADLCAVVSDIWRADSIASQTKKLVEKFKT